MKNVSQVTRTDPATPTTLMEIMPLIMKSYLRTQVDFFLSYVAFSSFQNSLLPVIIYQNAKTPMQGTSIIQYFNNVVEGTKKHLRKICHSITLKQVTE